jgi:hypothetical protein
VTIDPDGRHARGRWYGFLMEARPTMSLHKGPLRQTWAHGIYENEYVKEADVWKFNKLHFFLNFRTPYEDGWVKIPVVGQNGPSSEVPPDAPPTAWHPYPTGYRLPLHFEHPITGVRPPSRQATDDGTLEKQVTLLEDIQAIEDLQRMYGYYFDNQKFAEVIDLFSENTESIEITDHGVFLGKEGVKRMYSGMIGNPFPPWIFFEVMQTQGVIDVAPDGKTATGRWYTPSFEARPFSTGVRSTWQFGVYDNVYVKEDGKWFFKKLHWNMTYWTSFERGFLKVPKLGDNPFPNADAPATAYHPYPSGYHVPYPFKHPITGK